LASIQCTAAGGGPNGQLQNDGIGSAEAKINALRFRRSVQANPVLPTDVGMVTNEICEQDCVKQQFFVRWIVVKFK
jgi:hypothetical protein